MRLLLAGVTLVVVAVFTLLAVTTAYWPFQPAVQVIAPFLGISIFTSVGVSLIFASLLLRGEPQKPSESADSTSVLDSLIAETRRR